MIFVDSNIPMYLVGADHPRKVPAKQHLERLVTRGKRLVTDAEVLQEILHRYTAIRRPEAIQPAFDALLGVVDEVFGISLDDVQLAKSILSRREGLSARDAIHLAVMERERVEQVLSFDTGFDDFPGIDRIGD